MPTGESASQPMASLPVYGTSQVFIAFRAVVMKTPPSTNHLQVCAKHMK